MLVMIQTNTISNPTLTMRQLVICGHSCSLPVLLCLLPLSQVSHPGMGWHWLVGSDRGEPGVQKGSFVTSSPVTRRAWGWGHSRPLAPAQTLFPHLFQGQESCLLGVVKVRHAWLNFDYHRGRSVIDHPVNSTW